MRCGEFHSAETISLLTRGDTPDEEGIVRPGLAFCAGNRLLARGIQREAAALPEDRR